MALFGFRATIAFESEIEAADKEAAELEVFERLADEVTSGEIRVDRFDQKQGPELQFPQLDSVEVWEVKA